jgi:glutaredoxin
VVLLGRQDCHLCDVARDVVARVSADLAVAWQERDVDEDPGLAQQYSDLVPVVFVDGRQHAYWRVDERRLRAVLAQTAG